MGSLRAAQSGGRWSPWPGSPADAADPGWACGKEGQRGKTPFCGSRGLGWPRDGAAVPGQRWLQAPRPPQHRGGVCRRTGEGDKKAKMKVKNQRKRDLGVKGGAGAPTGPGGRRGPSAVRAGEGVGEAGISFHSQGNGLLKKDWLARKTSWGSCVLGP